MAGCTINIYQAIYQAPSEQKQSSTTAYSATKLQNFFLVVGNLVDCVLYFHCGNFVFPFVSLSLFWC